MLHCLHSQTPAPSSESTPGPGGDAEQSSKKKKKKKKKKNKQVDSEATSNGTPAQPKVHIFVFMGFFLSKIATDVVLCAHR